MMRMDFDLAACIGRGRLAESFAAFKTSVETRRERVRW